MHLDNPTLDLLNNWQYLYASTVVDVYDGDTLTVDMELGFGMTFRTKLRLHRINAWEVRGEEREKGLEAKAFLQQWCPPQQQILVKTHRDRTGKYGRYLAEIFSSQGRMYKKKVWLTSEYTFENVNDLLVKHGHAVYKEY